MLQRFILRVLVACRELFKPLHAGNISNVATTAIEGVAAGSASGAALQTTGIAFGAVVNASGAAGGGAQVTHVVRAGPHEHCFRGILAQGPVSLGWRPDDGLHGITARLSLDRGSL